MNLENVIKNQREFFLENNTKSYDFRLKMLKKLRKAIVNHEEEILTALEVDLGKSTLLRGFSP